jgi:hypothetical protein
MAKKKLRSLGQITSDMELLLQEMTDEDQHDMQRHEVIALVEGWIIMHAENQIEERLDGTRPILTYR